VGARKRALFALAFRDVPAATCCLAAPSLERRYTSQRVFENFIPALSFCPREKTNKTPPPRGRGGGGRPPPPPPTVCASTV